MKQIANYLRNLRVQKGLTEKDIVDNTTLTLPVIHLIESGEFKSIGAEFYVKNFLKQYCKVIGLTDSETEEVIEKILKSFGQGERKILSSEPKRKNGKIWVVIIIFIAIVLLGVKFLKVKDYFKDAQSSKISITEESNSLANGKPSQKKQYEKNYDVNKKSGILSQPSSLSKEVGQSESKSVALKEKGGNPEYVVTESEEKGIVQKTYDLKFQADCMCWINVSSGDKTIKDFILKKGESFTMYNVPADALLNIGDASCLRIFVNGKEIILPKKSKVLKDFKPEL